VGRMKVHKEIGDTKLNGVKGRGKEKNTKEKRKQALHKAF